MKKRLAIISSHPIQYNAPMFALLAKSEIIEIKVFYTWSQSKESLFDKDFGKQIQWDIPLLEGYEYEFIENISPDPGPHHFKGIVCPGLINAIKNWKAEALLVYGWNYKAHYDVMRQFKGKIPVYFRGDSTLLDETGGAKQLVRRLFLKWIYRSADYAFFVGENSRQYFLKHGFKNDHLFYAPHAIENSRFSDNDGVYKAEAKQWRTELGFADDDILVLFVGKFEPKKNPLILIHAAKQIKYDKLHFVFVGNGNLEDEMKKESEGMKNIHFLPFQNQSRMPVVYYLSNILALPSQGPGETWGLVVNEAMACERAILVSTKSGCSIDLVENDKNGYIFESGNLDQVVSYLEKMTTSRETLQKMGAYSKEKIQKWSFAEICKSFEQNLKT